MDTHITGKCPHCKSEYRLRAYAAGKRARCKTCRQVFVVPGEPVGNSASMEDSVVAWLNKPVDDDEEETMDTEDAEDEEDELFSNQFASPEGGDGTQPPQVM